MIPDMNKLCFPHGGYIACIIDAKTPCSSGNLFNLLGPQRSAADTVEFFCLQKYDPSHRQVKSHTDGIRGNHYFGLSLMEQMHLPTADLRWQTSIDHTGIDSCLLQSSSYIQHGFFRKCNQRIAFLYIIRKYKGMLLADQIRLAFIPFCLIIIPTQLDQMTDSLFCCRAHTDMDLRCPKSKYCFGP